jgi:arsenate reductase
MVSDGGIRGGRPPMRGGSRQRRPGDEPDLPPDRKKRVLFVCIGNSCRSQMAEAFARRYAADDLDVRSAGLAPAPGIAALTRATLAEWNLQIDDHFPKPIESLANEHFDVIVNMSGFPLKGQQAPRIIDWTIEDPIGKSTAIYRAVAQQIESLVMGLIMDLRPRG